MAVGQERAGDVEVPDVVGMVVAEARTVVHETGLVLTSRNPDGPPIGALTWPGIWRVTDQSPDPGAWALRRSVVVVGFASDGDDPTGVREPRRPLPLSDRGVGRKPLPSDEEL